MTTAGTSIDWSSLIIGAVIGAGIGAILTFLIDRGWRFLTKKCAERAPLAIQSYCVRAPAQLALLEELDSLEIPGDVAPFDYILDDKKGVWCGKVLIQIRMRSKSISRMEIENFRFRVSDSTPRVGATIYFVPAGANEALGFVVDLDEETPKADACSMANGIPSDIRRDYFGNGSTIAFEYEETVNIELMAKVERKCRTFEMDIEYSIIGKRKRLKNILGSPITVTPLDANSFKQNLVSIPGRRAFEYR